MILLYVVDPSKNSYLKGYLTGGNTSICASIYAFLSVLVLLVEVL